MKIKLWVHIQNCGDGSAVAKFFNSLEEAEEYAEEYGGDERLCEDVYSYTLEIDETGKIVNKN